MSSTNKTTNLGLSSWLGSDIPTRSDFNDDNQKIDETLGDHMADTECHISDDERERWNKNMYITTYVGDGTSLRTVETSCTFTARLAFVFAINYPLARTKFSTGGNYNYFCIATSLGHSIGVSLLGGKSLMVRQSTAPEVYDEYNDFNENGVSYMVVLIR